MLAIEIRARVISAAIKNGGGKITEESARNACAAELKATAPEQMLDVATGLTALFTNISGLNQEGERYGCITRNREVPALWQQVKTALAA